MILQGRNLELNMRGDDVSLLQDELRQLDFDIDESEASFGTTTLLAVETFQRQHDLRVNGVVDAITARAINLAVDTLSGNLYLVKGTIVRVDGSPVVRARVALHERKLRSEESLGESTSDGQGAFEITYPQPQETPLSVLVRAFSRDGQEIAASNLICNVKPVEEVTLVVGGEVLRGPSEYTQLESILRPALAAEQLDPASLNEEDVTFLACKFDLDPEQVALFVVSARHHRETDIKAEAFYGLMRQGLSSDLKTLIAQSQETLRDALVTATEENIISPELEASIPRILSQLQHQIVRLALQDPDPDRPTFTALFDIAGVESRHRQRILEDYVNREGTVEEYWQQLRDEPDISNDELDQLQETLKLSTIALNHVDLVSHISRLQSTGTIGPQLRDLGQLQSDGWRELLETEVDGRAIGAPEFFGADEAERIERYAEFLPRMVESIFPTAVLTHRLAEVDSSEFNFSSVLGFLNRNPDFEFRNTLVQHYLDENTDALVGIPEAEETVTHLKSMQRLFEIAPAFNKTQAVARLMTNGTLSATAIRRMGPTQFIRQNREALGFEAAQEMYTRAARKADTTLFLLSQSQAFNPTNLAMIAQHRIGSGLPDLEDLFGSLDLCKCEHCNSVYSPAAYMVDILHYLMNRPTVSGGRTALDALFDRRPDLGEIELNCHNTNTVLPYVDLVLEVLEAAVVDGGTLTVIEEESSDEDRFFPFQTLGEADDLAANPEHLNTQVYEVLRSALYPWSLPFDLWTAEVRIYLDHLGVPFHELLTQFSFTETEDSRATLAAEYLGLTAREREIVTDAENDPLHQLMGFENLGELNQFMTEANAAQLIDRSGLSFEELRDALEVRFVERDVNLSIRFDGADCDLDTAVVANLDRNPLDRLQRFVRLWRKQTWSISELGTILETLDARNLSDDDLVELAQVKELQTDLKVRLPVLLNWLVDSMSMVGVDDQASLYEQVFLDPAVHKPELAIFELDGGELADTSQSLLDHVPIIYSALGISAADLILLIEAELTDVNLNIANLTRLYQVVSLSKQLKLSIAEYIALRGLSGANPFGADGIARLNQFVALVNRVKESRFSVAQLDYLLRHQQTGAALVGPLEEDVTAVLATLRAGLYQISLEHISPESSDAILQTTENKMALVLPPDELSQILTVINRTSNQTEADQISLVEGQLSPFLNTDEVITAWFSEDDGAEPDERAQVVLVPLLQYLRRIANENLVVEAIASAHGIELSLAEQLLRQFVSMPDSDESSMEIFLADEFVPPVSEPESTPPNFLETTNPSEFPQQYFVYERLAKVTLVLNTLKVPLVSEDIEFFFTSGVAAGWLDLNALPLDSIEQAATELDAVLGMAELFQIATGLFGELAALFNLLRLLEDADVERPIFLESVASLSGWYIQDLSFMTGASALNIDFPSGFRDGQFLVQLKSRFQLLRMVSVSAEAANQWATEPVTVDTASAVKQVARAKYENKAQWLSVATPLRDELREQQRAALVAFLVHEQGLSSPNDLYAHFLIDVEMDPCMLTSRIVLAHSSIQLFVQRCLLNLEPAVELSPEDAKEWGWMKRYRVWEANRKVFLYPENWVYPELRDDKTPLFKELESGLLQDEINEATIEREYLKYLNGLNQIAQLEISGIYREWEVDRDTLHVFGRTPNAPRTYFYRKWVDQRYWTAWEKVDADIEGDHLVPVVWNRRVYLFWPIFEERNIEKSVTEIISHSGTARDPDTNDPIPVEVKKPVSTKKILKFDDIKMAWSEYREGSWSPKQISVSSITTNPTETLTDKSEFSFWPQFDDQNRLYILYQAKPNSLSHIQIGENAPFNPQQFRFSTCDGRLEATKYQPKPSFAFGGLWDPFTPVYHELRFPFPYTDQHFNNLKEKQGNFPLLVATGGQTETFGFGYGFKWLASNRTGLRVLDRTPSSFNIILPSTERIFVSRSPFIFYDQQRTFLIVPRGTYSGGFSDPDIGLTFSNSTHIPLELPDSATRSVANFVANNRGGQTTVEAGENLAVLSSVGTLLSSVAAQTAALTPLKWKATDFRFENHYHPYVCLLLEELNRYGIDGVLKPDAEKEKNTQRKNVVKSLYRQKRKDEAFFDAVYDPNESVVDTPRPKNEFDFEYGSAYSAYNWELFFHAPLMLAKRFSDNQRFAEAHRWFHYMFDPTYRPNGSQQEAWPQRVWQIKPFFEEGVGESIRRSMLLLKSTGLTAQDKKERKNLQNQVEAWRKDPFNPHLIARMRPEAYMKATVMAYIDNLITWADHLFGQDSMESTNEATQLYILAAEILGERPQEVATHENTISTINGEEVRTFNDLRGRLDAFSNVLVELESLVEPDTTPGDGGGLGSLIGSTDFAVAPTDDEDDDLPLAANIPEPSDSFPLAADVPLAEPIPMLLGPSLFFCIPKNDKLLSYWDTVADRLFKIRHCMNIEGVVRQLALFEAPIDPGLLVKAAAAGIDIGSVLNDLNAPLLPYRFQVLLQKASELTRDVINLGASLLAALEKRDAETLALLRANLEVKLLQSVKVTRELQIEEAEEQKRALEASQDTAQLRSSHYQQLVETGLTNGEGEQIGGLISSALLQALAGASSVEASLIAYNQADYSSSVGASLGVSASANIFSIPPGVSVGGSFGESLSSGTSGGGTKKSAGTRAKAEELSTVANTLQSFANLAGITSGFSRREEEWLFQQEVADKDVLQLDKQIGAASIRIELAKNELHSHEIQMENSKEVEEYMRSKYTNQELYSWMVSQISTVYFQSYKLAYDLAKRAEKAFQHELGITDSNYIQFGYWDSLKKGLLSGEKLHHDLKRLDVAYLEENRREYEITQHFSLALLDANALLQLRETGECEFSIPELAFDLNYSGQYMRRIKSVSVTVPCVTGPYTNVNARLTLVSNRVRTNGSSQQTYNYTGLEDPNFRHDLIGIQSIATSSGDNDNGVFQLNFQDDRYVPFERAGAISTWRLSLPGEFRGFDYSTISDIVLHMNYTAREGGDALRSTVDAHVSNEINRWLDEVADDGQGLFRLISLKQEFSSQLHRLLVPEEGEPQTTELPLTLRHFPHLFQGRELTLTVSRAMLVIKPKGDEAINSIDLAITVNGEEGSAFAAMPDLNGLMVSVFNLNQDIPSVASEPWELAVSDGVLDPENVEDLYLLVTYTISTA